MKSLLDNRGKGNRKSIKKEVRKMKKICLLTVSLFLLVGVSSVFASSINPWMDTSQTKVIHIEYYNNAYSVGEKSISTTTTITTTLETDEETGVVTEKRTTNTTTSISSWKGGSLKVESVVGTTDMNSTDGSVSHTDSLTIYDYNDQGQLAGVHGGLTNELTGEDGFYAHTEGSGGQDADGNDLGRNDSWTMETYEIHNGEALRVSSVNEGKVFGVGEFIDTALNETTTVSEYTYENRNGSWVLMQTVSTFDSVGVVGTSADGDNTHIVTTTTYERDANGAAMGMSQTKEGQMVRSDPNTGGRTVYTLDDYEAIVAVGEQGYYIVKESWNWNQVLVGDVNNDGVVDSIDADLILQHLDGLIDLETDDSLIAIVADVDGNGTIEQLDVDFLLAAEAGLVDLGAVAPIVRELGLAGLPGDLETVQAYFLILRAQLEGWLELSAGDLGGGEYTLNFDSVDFGDTGFTGMDIHHAMDLLGLHGNDQGQIAFELGDGSIFDFL